MEQYTTIWEQKMRHLPRLLSSLFKLHFILHFCISSKTFKVNPNFASSKIFSHALPNCSSQRHWNRNRLTFFHHLNFIHTQWPNASCSSASGVVNGAFYKNLTGKFPALSKNRVGSQSLKATISLLLCWFEGWLKVHEMSAKCFREPNTHTSKLLIPLHCPQYL